MKLENGFTAMAVIVMGQMIFVAALWTGAAYVVYKLLQYFGVL